MEMTITGGQVITHEVRSNGATVTFGGSFNAAGEVSGSFCRKGLPCTSLAGTIHDKVFEGSQVHGYWCYHNVRMTAAPRHTTPFDGWYSGVSRAVLDGGNTGHTCDPCSLGPPASLKIANGVVGNPGGPSWQGTVSPQGAVVMHRGAFIRVDGQIDPQGTIRGQYSGDIPPRLGGGSNCIIKFVWQKE
jgi:hypothetical protein